MGKINFSNPAPFFRQFCVSRQDGERRARKPERKNCILGPYLSPMQRFTLFLSILGSFWLSSCEEIEEAANIELDTALTETFVFTATEPTDTLSGAANFSETGRIDLNQGVTADYLDNLKEVEIESIELRVLSYQGTEKAQFSGAMDFGGGRILTIEALNLRDYLFQGQVYNLEDEAGTYAYIADVLLNSGENEIEYFLGATISEVPVSATIQITYQLSATANPLD